MWLICQKIISLSHVANHVLNMIVHDTIPKMLCIKVNNLDAKARLIHFSLKHLYYKERQINDLQIGL